ncbi:ankyrin repeat protein, putative [Trichomonas vaginalis G3]|uniref:Ankyrin repeat protein, putative n=1 Tax=Trichomonas vaginalis (strain ATCC PRA-98 / G3) TaxID=412133 RepID=A2EXB6_TRIV3|nr:nerve growth factor signaling pathway [Trichomonas vaginalis G3]EAY02715.1 ankyrin repeat protein, putative [Trichomonas vaginalis G3]KAI5513497.1 nerve growth factor signaling pathway [Trichomonas vaginalis G3]|eukprot:XP_001314938.1 ankyrin repeat protein [Trichomonas vaginalis G3]
MNFEYVAAHISNYINNENFLYAFNMRDIKTIMKYSYLASDQYFSLLKQSSSTINAKELYICTRRKKIESEKGILSLVKSLIECYGDKDVKTNYGKTPFILASCYGYLDIVQYLIAVGADKEAKTSSGKIALMLAKDIVRDYLMNEPESSSLIILILINLHI